MRLSKLLFNTTTMMIVVVALISVFAALIFYIAVYEEMDIDRLEVTAPVLALLVGYLISTGTQISRDRTDRAKQFIEARRTDQSFRDAAQNTWKRIQDTHGVVPTEPARDSHLDILDDISAVADVYEEMAILIKYRHVDEDLLFDYFGNPVIRFFACYKDEINSFRSVNFKHGDIDISTATEYIELEWLYSRWLPRYQNWIEKSKSEFT